MGRPAWGSHFRQFNWWCRSVISAASAAFRHRAFRCGERSAYPGDFTGASQMKLSILAATANVSTCGSRAAGAKRHASKPWPGASQNEPPLPDHDYHVMSDAELSATIKEASQAAIAMRGVNAGSQRDVSSRWMVPASFSTTARAGTASRRSAENAPIPDYGGAAPGTPPPT